MRGEIILKLESYGDQLKKGLNLLVQFIIAYAICNVDVDTLCSVDVDVDVNCSNFQLQIMFLMQLLIQFLFC